MKFTRQICGRGFTYFDELGHRVNTKIVEGKKRKEWIEELAIPPAWEGVRIDSAPGAKIIAYGRDASGKKQYIYNPEWVDKRSEEKFERTQRFALCLDHMREVTGKHLRELDLDQDNFKPTRNGVLACMVRLIDSAYFRPGNERYSAENQSFGITTLRSRHLITQGDELEFQYQGKSGVEQHKTIVDPKLVKIVQELDDHPGYRIFKYIERGRKQYVSSGDLNTYIAEVMGEGFSAKDFRTWAGTLLTAEALAESQKLGQFEEPRKAVITALEATAQRLGNTPTVCEQNYVDPRIIEAWEAGKTIADFRQAVGSLSANLSLNEQATISLLEALA